jgi:hypothetical protein
MKLVFTRPNVTLVIYEAGVFVPDKLIQNNLLFVNTARILTKSGAPRRCFTRVGSGLTSKH